MTLLNLKGKLMNNSQTVIDFLTIRRSVTAKTMVPGRVDKTHLQIILLAGLGVPAHGALNPWRLVVIKGDAREKLDRKVILPEFQKDNPEASEEIMAIEGCRMQRADVVIAVLSKPVEHKSIQQWEMHLSAGAVCTTLLYAAQSLGYAAQWLTEWYAYNDQVLAALGGSFGKERIAGFVYIGEKTKDPIERTRPKPELVISYL